MPRVAWSSRSGQPPPTAPPPPLPPPKPVLAVGAGLPRRPCWLASSGLTCHLRLPAVSSPQPRPRLRISVHCSCSPALPLPPFRLFRLCYFIPLISCPSHITWLPACLALPPIPRMLSGPLPTSRATSVFPLLCTPAFYSHPLSLYPNMTPALITISSFGFAVRSYPHHSLLPPHCFISFPDH